MIEKLLLASILTFSFSLFTDLGRSYSQQELVETVLYNQKVLVLTQSQEYER